MPSPSSIAKVKFSELLDAFHFGSLGDPFEHRAFINPDTETIFYLSEGFDTEDEVPDDFETSDQCIAVPHKHDLNLGRHLVLSFAEEQMPDNYDVVAGFFRKKGAYRRFKDFLEDRGQLEQWYAYEAQAIELALRAWAEEAGIEFLPEQTPK